MNYVTLLLMQLVLLLGWYLVPEAATVPAWVVFLPLIGVGVGLAFAAAIWIAVALLYWWANR